MIIDITKDNKDVGDMVLAAKQRRWVAVRKILEEKPYLINCVPEDRAWSALHQAVYWNDSSEVSNLLSYETCDALVKSKQCQDKMIPPNSTALILAKKNSYDDIAKLLEQNTADHRARRFKYENIHFVKRAEGEAVRQQGFPLLALGVVMYKNTLVGDPHTHVRKHSVSLMKKIYENEAVEWEHIEEQLFQALYGHCKESAEAIRTANAKDEKAFFEELIKLYTTNILYIDVNAALGREFHRGKYNPSADDLALGLYALLLDITLTFWVDLKKVRETTYRGVGLNIAKHYVIGSEIMCTTLLSSSLSRDLANGWRGRTGTLFIFNNSIESSKHSKHPRNVSMYSEYKTEEECLYVLGTSFRVVAVDNDARIVTLSLL